MNYVHKVTRRMRCEIQGCKQPAVVGFGRKGIDFLLCEEHKNIIQYELNELSAEESKAARKEEVKAEEHTKEAVEETVEEQVIPKPSKDFFHCKYCGNNFTTSEMTPAEFAAHCKKCKKEQSKK